jgi:hypothetical protein
VLALGIETFDRDDLLSSDLRYGDLAGSYCLAVEMDGASAAQTRAASEFCAGHPQMFAYNPQ